MLSNILDRISFWSLFSVVVLLPIFFIPFTQIPVEASKTLLVVAGLVIAIVSWSAACFSDGKVVFPKSKILLSGFLVVVATLLSAIFSDNQAASFFGLMFDVGTFWFILGAFLLMLFLGLVIRTQKQAKIFLFGIIFSTFLLFFFQSFRYFLPSILSLGVLSGKVSNLFGSWNSFGYIAGLMTVFTAFVLEFFSLHKKLRFFLYFSLALSLFTVIAVNSAVVWQLVGVFSLLIFIYKLANVTNVDDGIRSKSFPTRVFILVIISLLFFLSGKFIGNFIPNSLGISNIEVSPSLTTTFSVGKSSLLKDPVFGVGANRFNEIWSMWKPQIINNTQFWDTAFNSGFGFLPTVAITTGILGIIAWLLFALSLLFSGFRFLLGSFQSKENSINVLYFMASLFMLVACFLYSFGIAGVMLSFALIGLFIATTTIDREDGVYEFNFLNDPRKSFLSILVLVVIMLGSLGISFKFIERFASVSYFNKALVAVDAQNATKHITKAISLHESDLYFRTLAQIKLANLSILSQKQNLTDEDKASLQSSFDQAVAAANSAIIYDKKNYINYQMLGVVYSTAGRLGVEGAGDQAIAAYTEAAKYNPLNPGIVLSVANEYALMDKNSEAKKYATDALDLAPKYVDALVLLSQVERNLGNVTKASEYADRARLLDPNNKNIGNYAEGLKLVPDNTGNAEDAPANDKKQ